MRLSAINSFLSQSEAAILAVMMEKIMAQAEEAVKRSEISSQQKDDACECQDVAYAIRCCAEQSLLANDGEMMTWKEKVRKNEVLADWLDLEGVILTLEQQ